MTINYSSEFIVFTAQSFFNYVLLALVFGTVLAFRSRERTLLQCLKQWWWRYLLIALVDVEANYLVVKAYAYTTVTSVQVSNIMGESFQDYFRIQDFETDF